MRRRFLFALLLGAGALSLYIRNEVQTINNYARLFQDAGPLPLCVVNGTCPLSEQRR
jgi:hypothetical protein